MITEKRESMLRHRSASIRPATRMLMCCAGLLGVGLASPSTAELIDRGGGLIYDTELDVTWLQDARYALTSGFDIYGRMIWPKAMSWVSELEYYDSVRDRIWSDWRLPNARDFQTLDYPCFGYDCRRGELGHLYYGHGVTPLTPGPFINVIDEGYWYETLRAPLPGLAWIFQFRDGKQDHTGPFEELLWAYPWPVRDGDVDDPPPPVPATGLGIPILALVLGMAAGARVAIRVRRNGLTARMD